MNSILVKTNFIVLILVIGSISGGIVDNVYERIKNTTSGLKQDVSNVWNYGKGMIGFDDPNKEKKDGLIGGKIHSIQHTVHEFWHIDEIPNDSGLLWNMYNRFKQRLARAKTYILGDDNDVKETTTTEPQNAETNLILDTMNELFNSDGTRRIEGKAFDDIVENLRKQLRELRPKAEGNDDIGVSTSSYNVKLHNNDKESNDSVSVQNVPSYIYDKAVNGVQTLKESTEKVWVAVPDVKRYEQNIKDEINKVSDGVVDLKDKVLDTAAREKDLFDKTISQNEKVLSNNVKQSLDELTQLTYKALV